MPATREELTFPSGEGRCAAWLHRPAEPSGPVPCVVMAHGFSLTRHDGLDALAERLAAAGVAVLVYDFRHLGDSPGEPRQRFRLGLQREDVRSAIAFARTLDGVDPQRIVLWGYSFSGAHAVTVAAEQPDGIAAVLLLCPFLDGLWRGLQTPPRLTAWIVPRAIADALGRHTTVPVTAPPGGRGAMTLPGEADGFARAVAPGSPWRNRISPAIFLKVSTIRPVRQASKLPMPVWVGDAERDQSVSRTAIARFVAGAPRAERQPYSTWDHFDPWVGDAIDRVAADQVAFLRRQGLAS